MMNYVCNELIWEILNKFCLQFLSSRSFEYLLSEVQKREETYVIKAAYLEVYNEKVAIFLRKLTHFIICIDIAG